MSIRSVDMMPIKSTLAVSAIILGGLVAASPFPYRHEPEARPQRMAVALAPDFAEPAAAGWVDPPARAEAPAVVATASTAVPDMQAPVAPAETAPASAAAGKPADRAAAKLAAKRAEQAKRRRLAQAAARSRQAALKQGEADDRTVTSAPPATAPADPITSLLHGLGFGRQG